VLGLKAVNCQNGDTLAQDQVTAASKEKVLGLLGKAHPSCGANWVNRWLWCRSLMFRSNRPPRLRWKL
jgi:hypothetical protein